MTANENQANAYRVIFEEYKSAYQTGDANLFAKVPDLDGEHFIELCKTRKFNNCTYLPNQKYLHFFTNKQDAISYADGLETTKKPLAILMFKFPEELLENCTFEGYYEHQSRQIAGQIETRKEYIIPLELYDAKKHYLGEVSPDEFAPKGYDPDADYYGMF